MYIPNEANKNKVTYISNKPSKDYFDTVQLDYLIDEFAHKKGNETVIAYLKSKLKELK
jgi:hypothetical protein